MGPSLRQETEKLAGSWMKHDSAMLRDYLVAGVEDPRLNLQSILSRHFLLGAITGERFAGLMKQEYLFAAAMNWLARLARSAGGREEFASVLCALRKRADNAEGLEIPHFLVRAFAAPTATVGLAEAAPNYIERFLSEVVARQGRAIGQHSSLDTFQDLWRATLAAESQASGGRRPTVLEPACGSANDYRFLEAYGIAGLIDYTGFDLCAKNIENARSLFPVVRFEVGNVFEIAAPDKDFDLCFVHDLFEHLSLEGMEVAVREVCRVTRGGLCVGFFQMDEIPSHVVRPVEDYHWNLLSMATMKELFERHGFAAQVIHIGAFLRQQVGCDETHNPNAYTFWLSPFGAEFRPKL